MEKANYVFKGKVDRKVIYPLIVFIFLTFIFILILSLIAEISIFYSIISTVFLIVVFIIIFGIWTYQKVELYKDKIVSVRYFRYKKTAKLKEINSLFYGYKAFTRQNRKMNNYLPYLCLKYEGNKQLCIVYFPFSDHIDFISNYILEHSQASNELIESDIIKREKEDTTKKDIQAIVFMYLILYLIFIPFALQMVD